MLLRFLSYLATIVPLVVSSICDTKDFVSFTGFKVAREERVNVKPFKKDRFLQITYCNKGKATFTTSIAMESLISGLNQTFCLSKEIQDIQHQRSPFSSPVNLLKQAFSKSSIRAGTRDTTSPSEDTTFRCFKIARLKRFANVETSFYVPYTFVGAIFECFPSTKQKEEYLQSLMNETDPPFKLLCDPSSARPLAPIIADDASKSSISLRQLPLSFSQIVPYLKSASPRDPRFTSKPSSWIREVNVNEGYTYHEEESKSSESSYAKLTKVLRKTSTSGFTRYLPFNSGS